MLVVEQPGEAVTLTWGAPPQECHLSGQFLQCCLPWMVEEAAPLLAPTAMGAAPLAGAVEQGLHS